MKFFSLHISHMTMVNQKWAVISDSNVLEVKVAYCVYIHNWIGFFLLSGRNIEYIESFETYESNRVTFSGLKHIDFFTRFLQYFHGMQTNIIFQNIEINLLIHLFIFIILLDWTFDEKYFLVIYQAILIVPGHSSSSFDSEHM